MSDRKIYTEAEKNLAFDHGYARGELAQTTYKSAEIQELRLEIGRLREALEKSRGHVDMEMFPLAKKSLHPSVNDNPSAISHTPKRFCNKCGTEGFKGDWSECFTQCETCWPVGAAVPSVNDNGGKA